MPPDDIGWPGLTQEWVTKVTNDPTSDDGFPGANGLGAEDAWIVGPPLDIDAIIKELDSTCGDGLTTKSSDTE